MRVLGISAFYHDSGAALVEDGEIVAAVQEERLTRVKHDHAFPGNAIRTISPWRRAASDPSPWPCRYGSATSCFRRRR